MGKIEASPPNGGANRDLRKLGARKDEGSPPAALKSRRHPGFGLMKGLTTITPGTDLTAPSGNDWGRSKRKRGI